MAVFEFLFNYPVELFGRGSVQIGHSWIAYALLASAAAVTGVAAARYFSVSTPLSKADRSILAGLRAAWIAILVLILFSPVLVVTVPRPQSGEVVVLHDDSLSMRLPADSDTSRSATLQRLLAPESGEVSRQLRERFTVQHVAFGVQTRALDGSEPPAANAPRSDIAAALRHARTRDHSAPLAGVVLASDGGAPLDAALHDELLKYRAAGIPVHTIGIGSAGNDYDLELTGVSLPPRLFPGDTLRSDVTVRHRGAGGQEVMLEISAEGVLLERMAVTVPEAEMFTVPIAIDSPDESGAQRLKVSLTSPVAEAHLANNHREALLRIDTSPARVLHFEGEPRFEVKFLRRAVSDDNILRVSSLIRTAENKYYRVGIGSAEELATGFPNDAESLFAYDVVILGSVAANLLQEEQQELLQDYVAQRGGALLMLGANEAFAEGGYGQSPLHNLLPVQLRQRESDFLKRVSVTSTRSGSLHPVVQALSRVIPHSSLGELPPLTVVNPLFKVKPGASVLLQEQGANGEPLVVLAYQRYGRGTVAVMAVRDTWRWQMHSDIAADDQTHETLWRELLRWLARPVPGRLEQQLEPADPVPGERVRVQVAALDADHEPLSDASLSLVVTTPLGDRYEVSFSARLDRAGGYDASFPVDDPGLYELETIVDSADGTPQRHRESMLVSAAGNEFHSAELNEPLLRRIAADTGGQYADAKDALALTAKISESRQDTGTEERLPLHDAPALFFGALLLLAAEWFYRRRRGLA